MAEWGEPVMSDVWDDQSCRATAVSGLAQLVAVPEAAVVNEITGDSLRVGQQGSKFTS